MRGDRLSLDPRRPRYGLCHMYRYLMEASAEAPNQFKDAAIIFRGFRKLFRDDGLSLCAIPVICYDPGDQGLRVVVQDAFDLRGNLRRILRREEQRFIRIQELRVILLDIHEQIELPFHHIRIIMNHIDTARLGFKVDGFPLPEGQRGGYFISSDKWSQRYHGNMRPL